MQLVHGKGSVPAAWWMGDRSEGLDPRGSCLHMRRTADLHSAYVPLQAFMPLLFVHPDTAHDSPHDDIMHA